MAYQCLTIWFALAQAVVSVNRRISSPVARLMLLRSKEQALWQLARCSSYSTCPPGNCYRYNAAAAAT